MVYDPDSYNFRMDAGNMYAANVNITPGAGNVGVLQIVNPAGSGVNARLVTVWNTVAAGGVILGFDTAALGGVVVTVQALKSGAAAGKVTANSKITAGVPATVTELYRLAQGGLGGVQNVPGGAAIPLLELTPGTQCDLYNFTAAQTLAVTVTWIEIPVGVV